MKRTVAAMLSFAMLLALSACSQSNQAAYQPVSGLDTSADTVIKIAIPSETNKALNAVSNAFMDKYPNVSVQIQYVEDYENNAVEMFKENLVDIIFSKDVTYTEYSNTDADTGESVLNGKTTDSCYYNFASDTGIDFSGTTSDISDNYRHFRTDAEGNQITYQYCMPLGGETRGLFVNQTLLESYGLSIPTNYSEFLTCCKTLKENGLVPIQGSVSSAAYGVGIAPTLNTIAHNEEALSAMSRAQQGVSRYFEDSFRKIYDLAANRYFDYKAVEATGMFVSSSERGQVESFLGLRRNEETMEIIKPENNSGYVAFLPYISSTGTLIQALIDEYELDTKLTFICAPLNDTGSSPAYITPYYGLCINKNSENLPWLREYINFVFSSENNKIYAENASIIPNTQDAMAYVSQKYNLNAQTDITLCGQVRFSDTYNGFTPVANAMVAAFKCSAQKYMINLNRDAEGNIQFETDENGKRFLWLGDGKTAVGEQYIGEEDSSMPGFAFCTLQYYLDKLETEFTKYRVG